MTRLRRLQRLAARVAIVAALVGLATVGGCAPNLDLPAAALTVLHPLLFVLGGLAGWVAALRLGEVDRERWAIAQDPDLTSGERQYAHREAEARRRRAAMSFLGAPLLVGYCATSQVAAAADSLTAQLLGVTALAGGILGLAIQRLVGAPRRP